MKKLDKDKMFGVKILEDEVGEAKVVNVVELLVKTNDEKIGEGIDYVNDRIVMVMGLTHYELFLETAEKHDWSLLELETEASLKRLLKAFGERGDYLDNLSLFQEEMFATLFFALKLQTEGKDKYKGKNGQSLFWAEFENEVIWEYHVDTNLEFVFRVLRKFKEFEELEWDVELHEKLLSDSFGKEKPEETTINEFENFNFDNDVEACKSFDPEIVELFKTLPLKKGLEYYSGLRGQVNFLKDVWNHGEKSFSGRIFKGVKDMYSFSDLGWNELFIISKFEFWDLLDLIESKGILNYKDEEGYILLEELDQQSLTMGMLKNVVDALDSDLSKELNWEELDSEANIFTIRLDRMEEFGETEEKVFSFLSSEKLSGFNFENDERAYGEFDTEIVELFKTLPLKKGLEYYSGLRGQINFLKDIWKTRERSFSGRIFDAIRPMYNFYDLSWNELFIISKFEFLNLIELIETENILEYKGLRGYDLLEILDQKSLTMGMLKDVVRGLNPNLFYELDWGILNDNITLSSL